VNKLRRKVELRYIPGDPPVPAIPPTCTTTTKRVSAGSSSGSGISIIQLNPPTNGGISTTGYIPVYGRGDWNPLTNSYDRIITGWMPQRASSTGSRYRTTTETTCTGGRPYQPGTPGTVEKLNTGPDWRASARSVERRSGDTVASFSLNDRPRVAVGFATNDTGASLNDLRMGVMLRTAGAAVEVIPITDGVESDTPAGYYGAGDRVSLIRSRDKFFVQVGGDVIYTGTSTTEDPVVLDAMLYTSDDYVEDPVLAGAVSASVTGSVGLSVSLSTTTGVTGSVGLRGLVAGVVDGETVAQVRGVVAFSGVANSVTSGEVSVRGRVGFAGDLSALATYAEVTGRLPAFQMFSADSDAAGGSVVLPSLGMDATSNPILVTAGADLSLPSFGFYSRTITGAVGTVQAEAPAFQMLAADSPYAGASVSMPMLTMQADDGYNLPGFQFVWENMDLADSITTDPSLYASIRFGLELQPELTFGVLVSDMVLDGLILDPTLSVGDFVNAMVSEGLNLSSATQGPTDIWGQYGFDLETGAATRYDNFEFDGFAYSPEATYAYRRDGVYLLRGGDDDGAPRNAMVDFGTTDFGTNAKKHIETAYVGLSTDGTVYLRLNADGRGDRTYRVVQRDPLMRARVGRGITARQWHAKLEIVDERSSELDGVEFHIAASARRWVK